MSALLEVRDLVVEYPLRGGLRRWLMREAPRRLRAVNHVSFSIDEGEALGLVGESGCGKSTLGRALLALEPCAGGEILFAGKPVTGRSGPELLALRRHAQMVFQDPVAALNARLSVRAALSEVLRVHGICPRAEEEARIAKLAEDVGLPRTLLDRRPRSLSGGQCQRVGIARALAMGAGFLVADEPTSALDVSVQAQIINLLTELREQRSLTLLFISHDLRVVRHLCDRVIVMYLGRIVEQGPTESVFRAPKHPYTRALMASAPRVGGTATERPAIQGEPPSPANPPRGCPFHPRCPVAMPVCKVDPFPAKRVVGDVGVWCHLYDEAPKGEGGDRSAPSAREAGAVQLASAATNETKRGG